jgi:hypothetical protein
MLSLLVMAFNFGRACCTTSKLTLCERATSRPTKMIIVMIRRLGGAFFRGAAF